MSDLEKLRLLATIASVQEELREEDDMESLASAQNKLREESEKKNESKMDTKEEGNGKNIAKVRLTRVW